MVQLEKLEEYFNSYSEVIKFLVDYGGLIIKAAEKIKEVLSKGNKILISSNGRPRGKYSKLCCLIGMSL